MAGRGFRKYAERRSSAAFKIQITSMVDMFVILLVFLLKTYSTSPVNINPRKGLRLPASNALTDPVDVVKLIVAEDGVFVENQKVMDLQNGKIPANQVDRDDPSFLKALYKALDARAKMAKNISKQNDSFKFDGKVLMQADRDLPYSVLKKVMYTSMLAGYSDVKLAVVEK